jgi:WD40 repeat protein
MYKSIKSIPLNGSIVSIKDGKKYFYLVDNVYNIYFVDKSKFDIIRNLNLSKDFKPLHKFSKADAISIDGQFNIAISNKSSSILLSSNKGIKKQKNIDNHTKDLEASAFSNDERYLATGGQDGKVYIHDMRYLKMVVALPNKPDYIQVLNFQKNQTY